MMPMREDELVEKLRPNVLTLRILLGALAAGVLVFALVAAVLRSGDAMGARGDATDFLSILGYFAAPVAIVLSRIMPRMMTNNTRKQLVAGTYQPGHRGASSPAASSETDVMIGVYQSGAIVSAAILEGAGFFNLVAYLLNGTPPSLGVGIGLAAAIAAAIPSARGMAAWVEHQVRLIAEERQLRPA